MLRPESNNFALAVKPLPSREKNFSFILVQATIKRLKYKVRNKILFSKKVELSKRDESRICIQNHR